MTNEERLRNEVLEEAAKVCDSTAKEWDLDEGSDEGRAAAEGCAAAIRALKRGASELSARSLLPYDAF